MSIEQEAFVEDGWMLGNFGDLEERDGEMSKSFFRIVAIFSRSRGASCVAVTTRNVLKKSANCIGGVHDIS
jgi:hypothetical protein